MPERCKMTYEIYQGDCLEVMRTMPENSVDLIATDPPYYRVKGEAWDRQWDNPKAFLAWLDDIAAEWHRLLKPNGSLYVFASPRMAARVEVMLAERFNILNRVAWRKHDGTYNEGGLWNRASKEKLRRFFEQKEEIIFAEHYGADNIAKGEAGYAAKCNELRGFLFEPLRAYLDGERKRAGCSYQECNAAIGKPVAGGGMATHYFSDPRTLSHPQWALPTRAHYEALQRLFNANGGDYLRREYDDLRREYEELRRPFQVTPDVPYTDVWTFPTVSHYPGKHPCEKPLALMEHIIRASTRPGAVVLDSFAGTGATGEACHNLGRHFIAIERKTRYVSQMRTRLDAQPRPQPLSFFADTLAAADD